MTPLVRSLSPTRSRSLLSATKIRPCVFWKKCPTLRCGSSTRSASPGKLSPKPNAPRPLEPSCSSCSHTYMLPGCSSIASCPPHPCAVGSGDSARSANPNKANALYSILFEAIALAMHLDSDRELLAMCVTVLGKFLMTKVRGGCCGLWFGGRRWSGGPRPAGRVRDGAGQVPDDKVAACGLEGGGGLGDRGLLAVCMTVLGKFLMAKVRGGCCHPGAVSPVAWVCVRARQAVTSCPHCTATPTLATCYHQN